MMNNFNFKKVIMKKLTISVLFSILCVHLISAQSWRSGSGSSYYNNDWSVGIGINAIEDSGNREIFDADNWNFGNPIYVSLEYYRNSQFSVAIMASFNKYVEGKNIDGGIVLDQNHAASYAAFDLLAKYSFHDLLNSGKFEPYVLLGPGFTQIGDYSTTNKGEVPAKGRMTINTGIGCNYWFSDNVGLNINGMAKFGIGEGVKNQMEASFGVMFKIPKGGGW